MIGPDWLYKIKAIVLDMDGTIYLENKLFPFTLPFLNLTQQKGIDICFFTNNSSRALEDYKKKLKSLQVPLSQNRLFNATQVMISYLKTQNVKNIHVLGTKALIKEFEDAGFSINSKPERVVLGFDTELNYEKLVIACDYIRGGVLPLGINPDFNCPVEKGMIPDCGSIGALIEASTGVKITYLGKPHKETFSFILQKLGVDEQEVAWVGDRLYTDIAVTLGTNAYSILVLSGETKIKYVSDSKGDFRPFYQINHGQDFKPLPANRKQPDLIVGDLSQLEDLLAGK